MVCRRMVLSTIVLLCSVIVFGASPAWAAKKKIVFLPGHQSHGWSGHAYTADCKLPAGILNKNVAGVETVVIEGDRPKEWTTERIERLIKELNR